VMMMMHDAAAASPPLHLSSGRRSGKGLHMYLGAVCLCIRPSLSMYMCACMLYVDKDKQGKGVSE
jgi:hypothetical protein